MADKIVLSDLRQRQPEAFKELYREYFNMVRYFVTKNQGSDADASDVFQDAIVVLFEKVQNPEFGLSCSLKTFLYAVSRNVWLSKLRDQNRLGKIRDFETLLEIKVEEDNTHLTNTQLAGIEKALQNLGENCRKLLEHFYYLKRSMKEIALDFGYTNEDNAKNQKYKCLQRLKRLVITRD